MARCCAPKGFTFAFTQNVADRAASVVLVVCLQGVTTWIMTKKGLFFCALNLPLVTAGCAVVFQTSRQLVQLVAAMACLKAFTQLNFGFTRTLWYAVPDAVRTLAYAVIGDFVRFETFSICRHFRLEGAFRKKIQIAIADARRSQGIVSGWCADYDRPRHQS